MRLRLLWAFGGSLAALAPWAAASAGQAGAPPEVLLKVKPAVVIIVTEVSGDVRLTCPNRPPQRVTPPSSQSHGTGYVVNPDGYILTNGHVVEPYFEKNDREVRETFILNAIAKACLEPGLSEERQMAAAQQLYSRVAPTAAVDLKKTLSVVLPNREKYVGEVKAYSPALSERPGKRVSARGGEVRESGKDVAVVKIDARNLPTVPLGDSDRVQVGQTIRIVGFPGVVLYHDLLDKRSAVEASVTSGTVSSLKRDARGAPVIQTDAAASWGNSGGPAINDQGEVVGMLTFISLTSDETQAIQGFNFLVPVNIAREFAIAANVPLDKKSPFTAVWYEAVERYARGDWAGAQSRLDAASRLFPNSSDVQRLQADVQIRLLQSSPWPSPLMLSGIAVAALAVAGGTWLMVRRRGRHAAAGPIAPAITTATLSAEEPVALPPPAIGVPVPLRVPAADMARALAQRADLVVVDVRAPSSYAASVVQARGALRATPEEIVRVCGTLAHSQGIVLYCDSPGEEISARAAQLLMERGYSRVAVLAGGFHAWEAAALPLDRTPHGKGQPLPTTQAALPIPEPESAPTLKAQISVDLPVGVKGAGPYFNARATVLRMTGLFLATAEPLEVGQKLRLTVFLKGEPLELMGSVSSVRPAASGDHSEGAEVAFDRLGEEASVMLEGFILAHLGGGTSG